MQKFREFLSAVTFVVVTGILVHGAWVAQDKVHHSPLLMVVGCVMALVFGALAGRAVAPKRS